MKLEDIEPIEGHLDTVVDWILKHPAAHDQRVWSRNSGSLHPVNLVKVPGDGRVCRTRACVAGWGVIMAGYTVKNSGFTSDCIAPDGSTVLGPDEWSAGVNEVARRLFGLNSHQAGTLFRCDNDRDEIDALRREYTAIRDA